MLQNWFQAIGRLHQDFAVLLNKLFCEFLVEQRLSCDSKTLQSDFGLSEVNFVDFLKVFRRVKLLNGRVFLFIEILGLFEERRVKLGVPSDGLFADVFNEF